ncbi:Ran-specific GTPase-activating protein 30, partial [Cryomyces antarcticus]
MDILLGKVTQQAMNYAIRYVHLGRRQQLMDLETYQVYRSGITITSGYAIRQCGRLLK